MSNQVKQIDLLNRNSLVLLGKKLQIKGYTNNFMNPYRNMEYLKREILKELSNLKKRNRRNSTSTHSSGNEANMNGGSASLAKSNQVLRKSKSLPNLSSQLAKLNLLM